MAKSSGSESPTICLSVTRPWDHWLASFSRRCLRCSPPAPRTSSATESLYHGSRGQRQPAPAGCRASGAMDLAPAPVGLASLGAHGLGEHHVAHLIEQGDEVAHGSHPLHGVLHALA